MIPVSRKPEVHQEVHQYVRVIAAEDDEPLEQVVVDALIYSLEVEEEHRLPNQR